MLQTKIEWTQTVYDDDGREIPSFAKFIHREEGKIIVDGATFNPWWGCEKVDQECKFCYAEYLSDVRMKKGLWGPAATTDRRLFPDKHWNEVLHWNAICEKVGVKMKVFCASMADVFENHPQVNRERERLFQLIENTPNIVWLLLTKRPENIIDMMPTRWLPGMDFRDENGKRRRSSRPHSWINSEDYYGPDNIWFGTTCGTFNGTVKRLYDLLELKDFGLKLFISMEPLLEEIDFYEVSARWSNDNLKHPWRNESILHGIDQIIIGGESGNAKKIRPMHINWALKIKEQCEHKEGEPVHFFFKQWGEWKWMPADSPVPMLLATNPDKVFYWPDLSFSLRLGKKEAGRELNGIIFNQMPSVDI